MTIAPSFTSPTATVCAGITVSPERVKLMIRERVRRILNFPDNTEIEVNLDSAGNFQVLITHEYTTKPDLPRGWLDMLNDTLGD